MYKRYIDNIDYYLQLPSYGSLNTPVIRRDYDIDLSAQILPFNIALNQPRVNYGSIGVHFFIDDYQFVRIWNRPQAYIETLKKFKFIIAPDFSLYLDFPKAYQMFNHWRKHAFSSLAQANGVKLIPSLSWSTEDSFNWCFDGIERGSIVAVSSVGCMNVAAAKELFIKGIKKAIEIVQPKKIIYFGEFPEELLEHIDLIIFKQAYTQKYRNGDVI